MGAEVDDIDGDNIRVWCDKRPKKVNIKTLPYPGFPTDLQPQMGVVLATAEGSEDTCKLVAFARKSPTMFDGEWIDNDHFKLLIGCCNRKQCCDVSFTDGKITAVYSLCKIKRGE